MNANECYPYHTHINPASANADAGRSARRLVEMPMQPWRAIMQPCLHCNAALAHYNAALAHYNAALAAL